MRTLQARPKPGPVFAADDVATSANVVLALSRDLVPAGLLRRISQSESGERLWWVGSEPLVVLEEYGVDIPTWQRLLEQSGLLIRAYHSTRARDARVFRQTGIKPLDPDELYRRVRSKVLGRASGYELPPDRWVEFVAWSKTEHPIDGKLCLSKGPFLFLSRCVMDDPVMTKPHLHGPEFEEDLFRLLETFCDQEGLPRPDQYSEVLLRGTRGIILHCEIPFCRLDGQSRRSVLKLMAETLFKSEAADDAAKHYTWLCLCLEGGVRPEWIARVEYITNTVGETA
jgi:hypothetical protein